MTNQSVNIWIYGAKIGRATFRQPGFGEIRIVVGYKEYTLNSTTATEINVAQLYTEDWEWDTHVLSECNCIDGITPLS